MVVLVALVEIIVSLVKGVMEVMAAKEVMVVMAAMDHQALITTFFMIQVFRFQIWWLQILHLVLQHRIQ